MKFISITLTFFEIFCCRKRPDNMTNEAIAEKLKMLLHFRGNGKTSDKEYQELSDVIRAGLWLEYFNEDSMNFSSWS